MVDSSPAVANGVVYVGLGTTSNLYALRRQHRASKLWRYTTGNPVPPALFARRGERGGLYRFRGLYTYTR